MMKEFTVVLCDEKVKETQIKVWAAVRDGCLRISGQDLGKAVEGIFNTDEYEYFYDFDRENTGLLFALLADDSVTAEDALRSRFVGPDGCRALRAFCETNGVAYRFSNYY